MKKILGNIIGFFLKVGFIPFLIFFSQSWQAEGLRCDLSMILGIFLLAIGLIGVVYLEMVLLRFGDGRSHFSSRPDRLVDVGWYARTRHPYHWSLTLYHLGFFLLLFGIGLQALLAGMLFFLLGMQSSLSF